MTQKMLALAAAIAIAGGCMTVNKNNGQNVPIGPEIVRDKLHVKYVLDKDEVTATDSISVICGLFSFGSTASHIADGVPYSFCDHLGKVRNGAYANACDVAGCEILGEPRYKILTEDYFFYKKLTCEIKGFPVRFEDIELIKAAK